MSKSWNEDYWNRSQTKAILGLMALGIVLHHMAQKTCAPWLPDEYIVHGLEPFLNLGFIFVGLFFFCSGYGLYKSIKNKPDYLKGFIGNHLRPIILLYIISNVCFYMIGEVLNGYTWFIYAIVYLYFAFFISFKFCKNEKNSIILLAGFVILYVVYCEVMVLGTWVYNTVGIFLIGLLFAKYSDSIVAYIRSKYEYCLTGCILGLLIAFPWSLYISGKITGAGTMFMYFLFRWLSVILQFIAASSFSVLIFVLNQKIVIRSKALEFVGDMTLELYLIHVLFVEMFGYCFSNTENEAVCYIRNIFLYCLAVISLSLISAYALWWYKKGADLLYRKFKALFVSLGKDIKKYLLYILAALLVLVIFLTIINKAGESDREVAVDKYKDKYISYVNVDGVNISYYMQGEGEQTILVFKGSYDPCPTLSQKRLADELSTDFRVIVVDLPGSGFSDNPMSERTIENMCEELHGVAEALSLNKYILLSEMASGAYSLYYVNQYEDEVSAVVSVDGEYYNYERALAEVQNMSVFEYNRNIKKEAVLLHTGSRIADTCGIKTLIWPTLQSVYARNIGYKNDDVSYTMYFKNNNNDAILNERIHMVDNFLKTEELSYPENIQVIDLVSDYKRLWYNNIGINLDEYLSDICENKESHRVASILDGRYCIAVNPASIKKLIIENLE